MNPFIKWLIARLSEASTYAGIAALIASMAFWPQSKEIAAIIPPLGMAIASVLAIALPEAKSAS